MINHESSSRNHQLSIIHYQSTSTMVPDHGPDVFLPILARERRSRHISGRKITSFSSRICSDWSQRVGVGRNAPHWKLRGGRVWEGKGRSPPHPRRREGQNRASPAREVGGTGGSLCISFRAPAGGRHPKLWRMPICSDWSRGLGG